MQVFQKFKILMLLGFCPYIWANPNGIRTQIFNPNLDGIDYLSINSGKSLEANRLHLGLYFDRATNSAPRVLGQNKSINPREKKSQVIDEVYTSHFQVAYSFSDKLTLGLSLGANTELKVKNTNGLAYAQSSGINESRITAKYSLLATEHINTAIITNFHYNFLENNPYLPNDPFYYSVELAQSFDFSLLKFALNLGYIFRNSPQENVISNAQIRNSANQIYASAGLSLGDGDTRIINEIYYLKDLNPNKDRVDRLNYSVEVLLGLRLNYKKNTFYFAESTELRHGFSTADNRIVLGYQYQFTPKARARLEPKSAIPMPVQPERRPDLVLIEHISFLEGSSVMLMDRKTQAIFTRVLRNLKTQTFKGIIITGHTSQEGSTDFNSKLSLERAQAVVKHLTKNGIDINKIVALGMGNTRPITKDKDPETEYLNERIEIKIQK